MNYLKEIIFWVIALAYLITALSFVGRKQHEVFCSNIDMVIVDKSDNKFINKDDVIKMIKDNNIKALGYSKDSVNTCEIEDLINNHSSVKNSEVFNLANGDLRIEIDQRNPILRVINYNGDSYYIDEEGKVMPLSANYTSHVLVANGKINEPFSIYETSGVIAAHENDELGRKFVLSDLHILSKFINENSFWKAQIEQIYVNNDEEFELIPRVGTHLIVLGSIDDYKEKFRNLEYLYKKGFKSEGWNKYKRINLKYKNQIVCTKKELYE